MSGIVAECEEIALRFWTTEGQGIIGMNYEGTDYPADTELVITGFADTIQVTLYMIYEKASSVMLEYSYTMKNSTPNPDDIVEVEFGLQGMGERFAITLVAQNEVFQQFQIANVHPTTFTFDFNGRKHLVGPNSAYRIMREKTAEPVELTVYEEQWEDYPVTLRTPRFNIETMLLELELDVNGWVVGEPRTAKLSRAATVLKQGQSGDWVAADLNGDKKDWVLIPVRPGRLRFPTFTVDQQVVECRIGTVDILGSQSPVLICM
jgi:hypothetical protein